MNKTVYYAFYRGPKGKDILNKKLDFFMHLFICLVTFKNVSHCESLVDGISYSSSLRDGGVRSKEIDYNDSRWEFYETDIEQLQVYIIYRQFYQTRYDVRGAMSFALRFIKDDNKKVFCSEMLSLIAKLPNAFYNKQPDKISPGDLRNYCIARGFRKVSYDDILRDRYDE